MSAHASCLSPAAVRCEGFYGFGGVVCSTNEQKRRPERNFSVRFPQGKDGSQTVTVSKRPLVVVVNFKKKKKIRGQVCAGWRVLPGARAFALPGCIIPVVLLKGDKPDVNEGTVILFI